MSDRPPFETMTTEQLRDWLAVQAGWCSGTNEHGVYWERSLPLADVPGAFLVSRQGTHPIPNTLDAAAEAMPKGWTWIRHYNPSKGTLQWRGYQRASWASSVCLPASDDSVHDFFCLACECVWAEMDGK